MRKNAKSKRTRHSRAHRTEMLALAIFVIFSAYVLLLSNMKVSSTALVAGSVAFASDNPAATGLVTTGSNAYSIVLMWIISLALLAQIEIWLRKK